MFWGFFFGYNHIFPIFENEEFEHIVLKKNIILKFLIMLLITCIYMCNV